MANPIPVQDIMQTIREHRSAESNFEKLYQELQNTIAMARDAGNSALAEQLQEVDDKHVAAYQKAKETGGSAWPEFEKFITQFERTLSEAEKSNS